MMSLSVNGERAACPLCSRRRARRPTPILDNRECPSLWGRGCGPADQPVSSLGFLQSLRPLSSMQRVQQEAVACQNRRIGAVLPNSRR
jgi:hypothetical protein